MMTPSLDTECRVGGVTWNTLVVSLGNSAVEGKVMVAMVRNNLFNEEIRRKDFLGNDTHALVMENKGRSKKQRTIWA